MQLEWQVPSGTGVTAAVLCSRYAMLCYAAGGGGKLWNAEFVTRKEDQRNPVAVDLSSKAISLRPQVMSHV